MLGVCNKLCDSLNKTLGGDKFYEWLREKAIVRQAYHGGSLEGNQCKTLLSKCQEIREFLTESHKNFADCFEAFNALRKACFGMDLDPNWELALSKFEKSYRSLKINITPKVHSLLHHVPQFIRRYGSSLGPFSEQFIETLHSEYDRFWSKYRVPINHKSHLSKMTACFSAINSHHI